MAPSIKLLVFAERENLSKISFNLKKKVIEKGGRVEETERGFKNSFWVQI